MAFAIWQRLLHAGVVKPQQEYETPCSSFPESYMRERGFKFIQIVQSNILAIYDDLGIVSNKVKVMALSAVKGRGHIFAT